MLDILEPTFKRYDLGLLAEEGEQDDSRCTTRLLGHRSLGRHSVLHRWKSRLRHVHRFGGNRASPFWAWCTIPLTTLCTKALRAAG